MKKIVLATSLALGISLLTAPAIAMPASGPASMPSSSDIQQVQFLYGGRDYCWYNNGWRGPGFYWCGYAFRRGLGWGGGAGWHGWDHRRPHMHRGPGYRPHIGGRPGGRPSIGARPGGGGRSGMHGGGRGGGGRGGGHGGGHR